MFNPGLELVIDSAQMRLPAKARLLRSRSTVQYYLHSRSTLSDVDSVSSSFFFGKAEDIIIHRATIKPAM